MADVKETIPISPSTLSFDVELTAEELAKAVEDWLKEVHSHEPASAAK
jgi:hypothetical protein